MDLYCWLLLRVESEWELVETWCNSYYACLALFPKEVVRTGVKSLDVPGDKTRGCLHLATFPNPSAHTILRAKSFFQLPVTQVTKSNWYPRHSLFSRAMCRHLWSLHGAVTPFEVLRSNYENSGHANLTLLLKPCFQFLLRPFPRISVKTLNQRNLPSAPSMPWM